MNLFKKSSSTPCINTKEFKKMVFIYNALEHGWNVQKEEDQYIFKKKHQGEANKIQLSEFMEENASMDVLFRA